ncbi:MAG: Hsp33 family molecular chaperone HslO [Sterolibacteriaceae bacterium]|uniref:Hsp33 family molecular chaperone HslO n=1 Tax=Sulfuritalea sp. TaxID=2480090 RepID=UPI001A63E577|nr:Hsp33 family molecular chaperone HslO [Sulfuritalea sp.]MBL8478545.1 Hsp33 family molecular chaperone HslO [Sterolibacteriaceae bacterium]MBN8474762.1 Hsp33 family molecular chaperone HslO [Sulfuritalea sp.]
MEAVHRFLLEDLDIRGALVQLGPSWSAMTARRNYAAPVRDLLGELAAVTALIGSNLKTPGRLSFQLQGHGPVSMLVMDCNEKLQLRGMAKSELDAGADAHVASAADLLGDGRLVLTLQPKAAQTPYQSVVPLTGATLAQAFEHFLEKSEQQPARLWLTAGAESACGLFLQKLPNADILDPDGWDRIEQLAATVRADELLLPPETLLTRLFNAENVRLYQPRQAAWHCPRDEEKVRNMLLSLGREEIESMLADAEVIAIEDEICGHEYRFGAEILDELFPPDGRILH